MSLINSEIKSTDLVVSPIVIENVYADLQSIKLERLVFSFQYVCKTENRERDLLSLLRVKSLEIKKTERKFEKKKQ